MGGLPWLRLVHSTLMLHFQNVKPELAVTFAAVPESKHTTAPENHPQSIQAQVFICVQDRVASNHGFYAVSN